MINSSKKLGKVLYSYEPEVKYKKNDLLNFLKNVNLRDMLVKIGNISIELMRNENNTLLLNNVIPINHYIINISIEYAFKYCSCDLNDEIVDKDLFNFYDMCYCVSNDFKLDDDIDPMTYYSYKQLHYQQKILNQISRTYIIYSKLWDNNLEAKVSELYNIQKVIISEIGLDLRKILYLSILVTSKKNSFFNISELKNYIKENISKFNIEISNKNIIDYLDWISTPIHSINFNNSLDPLIQKPIVCSDTLEIKNREYIIPLVNNVVLKSTRGLYHHLSDLYSDGKNRNDFRKIFGYVFEEYVGKLLNCSLKQCDISPEIKFRIKKNEVKTIDWIVKNNEKLLLIEVKQSSINQKSKNSGNIDIITENFNNIVKSVKQINKTIEHIKSNKYKELKKYEDFRMVQGLIVINDPLYNSSYLCRDIVKRNINLENINIISIEEFETLFNQKRYFNKLFTLLMKKSRYNHDLDMNEYLIKNKFNFKHNNLLKDEFKEFFEDVRIK